MTVQELIDALEALPRDLRVYAEDGDGAGEVREVRVSYDYHAKAHEYVYIEGWNDADWAEILDIRAGK